MFSKKLGGLAYCYNYCHKKVINTHIHLKHSRGFGSSTSIQKSSLVNNDKITKEVPVIAAYKGTHSLIATFLRKTSLSFLFTVPPMSSLYFYTSYLVINNQFDNSLLNNEIIMKIPVLSGLVEKSCNLEEYVTFPTLTNVFSSCAGVTMTSMFIYYAAYQLTKTSLRSITLSNLPPIKATEENMEKFRKDQSIMFEIMDWKGNWKQIQVDLEKMEKTHFGIGNGQNILGNLRETLPDGSFRFYYLDWDELEYSNYYTWRAFHSTIPWVEYNK
jgi:hypothetical protein